MALSSAQIGRCGELMVQYQLLARGIESAPLTTDTGLDLVTYSPVSRVPLTIQVKTNLKPKRAGGTGPGALDWSVPHDSPAQLIALVDMSEGGRIWLFTLEELRAEAQQDRIPKSEKGKRTRQLHMYIATTEIIRPDGKKRHMGEFDGFLLENRVGELFELSATPVTPLELPRMFVSLEERS